MTGFYTTLLVCLITFGIDASLDSRFVDNIYFSINWAGPLKPLTAEEPVSLPSEDNAVVVTTTNKEQYRCILPQTESAEEKTNQGTSPYHVELELIKPLFDQTTCTYRLETYWTYELCHGRHLRQFHEEKEAGKPQKLQEYFLGRYKKEKFAEELRKAKELQQTADETKSQTHKVKKVQGIEIPYYEVVYEDGTVCDVTGAARRVTVQYVCQPEGRGEVYELKETSSCEYEAIVLTSLLCSHPIYGPKKDPVSTIQCYSLNESPQRPVSLDIQELENTVGRYNSHEDKFINSIWDALSSMLEKAQGGDDDDDDGALDGYVSEVAEGKDAEGEVPDGGRSPEYVLSTDKPKQSKDHQILKDFFEGRYCIQGGTGWWKHEFCYGKHVTQFHEDKSGKVTIVLGVWNTAKHLEWISNNPKKQPKPLEERKTLTHFYSSGDLCDVSGKQRFVEVRLKCAESQAHPNSVALYLVEPKPCEYKLVVESPLLCSLIEQADNQGLVSDLRL